MTGRVVVALDVPSSEQALALTDRIGPQCTFYKVGLELFAAAGPSVVRALRDRGKAVFLDLKLHDIPSTVAGAVAAAARSGARLITVHAMGGRRMLAAAAEAAPPSTTLLGVTVLTSLDAPAFGQVLGRPVRRMEDHVRRLAVLARDAQLGGVVCSAAEAVLVRKVLGPGPEIVTPGIRFAGDAAHDQRRTRTPEEALRGGATRIVVGRPVVAAPDPAAAFARVAADVRRADRRRPASSAHPG